MSSKTSNSSPNQPAFSMEDFEKALEQHDYQFQKGQTVQGKIFNYDSNGVYVDIGGKSPAFLPVEEISRFRIDNLAERLPLQSEHEFLIIRDQDENGQVTLSRLRLEEKRTWVRLGEMQTDKKTLAVRVTGLNKGGVTVDAQGVRGFIPRSHLVEREDLESLKGQTLTVGFLEVDPERKKLVFSQRQAARAASIGQFASGQLVEGKIVSIKPFGLFVEFGGTTGLLHINQISKNYIASLSDVFAVGQTLKAVILELDESKGRISLSTKVLENFPGEMLEQRDVLMSEAETRLEKVQKQLPRATES